MRNLMRFLLVLIAGIAAAALALGGLAIFLAPLILFFCLYRGLWQFGRNARFQRAQLRYLRREQKLRRREQTKRRKISSQAERNNIARLLQQIHAEIHSRKIHINPELLRDTRYFLSRCANDLDFEKALQVHQTLVATEPRQLNHALGKLMDKISLYH